jgi:hypothetical protein
VPKRKKPLNRHNKMNRIKEYTCLR